MKRMLNEMNEILAAPYIIGETAYNHEGDLNYLYKMIDDISEIKLNAVKFHLLLNPITHHNWVLRDGTIMLPLVKRRCKR